MNTAVTRVGMPSAGSRVSYGLGTQNQSLPGFVVLQNSRGTKGGPANWSPGFLPGAYQGRAFRSGKSPVLNLKLPQDVNPQSQRAMLDLAAGLNEDHLSRHAGESDLLAHIQSYELAFRMQK